ncbi:MAG: UDP-N-acetylmuramate--L-alanine ligase [Clostridiales bacterium]|nr:UDP-N-acetylmuramate--L-alanine ligase [Clostridiales bacterium]
MIFDSFDSIIKNKGRIHLSGIGGVSMSALAELLLSMGARVSGSDRDHSPVLEKLSALGAEIHVGHLASLVDGASVIIRTAAIHDDNPEIKRAKELSIPVLERAFAWGLIMQKYETALCISGTHGKTTTTSMASHIAIEAGLDPAVMVGGNLPIIGGGTLRRGSHRLIIAESCGYWNSFFNFYPTIAVILNIEPDHLDFFKDINEIIASFRAFAERTPKEGIIIVNADDQNAMKSVHGIDRQIVTFGLSEKADVYARNVQENNGFFTFDVLIKEEKYATISLNVPGRHNMYNALACAAASYMSKIPGEAVSKGLLSFYGAGRRFERKGTLNGASIIDDYAHHPSEMKATLDAAFSMGFSRVICLFQPHTYTRTKAFLDDFARELSRCDIVYLLDIYAAREKPDGTVSSEMLASKIENAVYCPDFDTAVSLLQETASEGDLILTMGAGSVSEVPELLLKLNSATARH